MNKADKELINKQTTEVLAEWWNIINHGEIPIGFDKQNFRHNEPKYPLSKWTEEDKQNFRNSRSMVAMNYINNKIGHKECLRYGNKDRMTNEEFEDFWRGNYEGDKEAKRRDDIRCVISIAKEHGIDDKELDLTKAQDDILNQIQDILDSNGK